MLKRALTVLAAFVVTVASTYALAGGGQAQADPAPAATAMQLKDLDCGDFPNQAAAQRYFIAHGGPQSDPDRLDSDGDGVACESNPCPCSTSTGGGGGTHPAAKKYQLIRLHKTNDSGRTVAVGRVPTLPNGRVQILRKVPGKSFRPFATTRTDRTGKIHKLVIAGPKRSCFQAVAPETKKYKRTVKQFACL